ncbi:12-oxophytodienoate reductase 1 [Grifola frondosa]|uniref:12-oxophytodienoate reductase 1 n=1 Tax=Grifola frondosa TaxID=5627 RepID=A0A1C7LND9_GRIFR|nr:12-oxophytodienoate reductase 1 [Grifola frondosa]
MANHADPLTAPFTLAGHVLRHRIALAPITRMRASHDGVPHPLTPVYYAQRTTPGGLLISEGTVVHPRGRGFPNTPGIYTPAQIDAWKDVTAAVHAKGGVIFCQVWHVGRVAVPRTTGGHPPLAATSRPLPGRHQLFGRANEEEEYVQGEALTHAGIAEIVAQFTEAARNAVEAGFDGVEIHGGNGYLLDTFVHDNINDREDEYGGSLENRLRFPLRVVDAIVETVGAKRTAIRIAPFHVLQETRDSDRMATFTWYAEELEKRGLAYIHVVEPRYDQLSTEGAFSGNLVRSVDSVLAEGNVETTRDAESEPKEGDADDAFSIWPFRRILRTTPLITAGGHSAASAREAVSEGKDELSDDFTCESSVGISGRADLVAFGDTSLRTQICLGGS